MKTNTFFLYFSIISLDLIPIKIKIFPLKQLNYDIKFVKLEMEKIF